MTHTGSGIRRPVRQFITVMSLALLSLTSYDARTKASGAIDDWRYNPGPWAPNHTYSILTNNNQATQAADVQYWMSWYDPSFWIEVPQHADYGVFELGWKATANNGCRNARNGVFTSAGFPSSVRRTVDYTEDSDDAVVWIADMDVVAAAQYQDPAREFYVSWDCEFDNQFGYKLAQTDPAYSGTVFNVSTNLCSSAVCAPFSTVTSSNLNYIPNEQAFRGIPPITGDKHTSTDSPWNQSWSFQADPIGWSLSTPAGFPGTWEVICDNVNPVPIRNCYGFVRAQNQNQGYINNFVFSQNFYVRTASDSSLYSAGVRTGKQFGGYVRCPTWAPGYAGIPGNNCIVDIYVHNANSPGAGGIRYSVPPDGKWYSVASDWFGASPNHDTWVSLFIHTYGVPIDLDGLWVSSGN